MAKMKRKAPWEDCPDVIYPLGRSLPQCMYGITGDAALNLRNIPLCTLPKAYRKEQATATSDKKEG